MEPNENLLFELVKEGKKWLKSPDNVCRLQKFLSSLPLPSDLSLECHEQICVGLSVALESNPNLWLFAKHYLKRDFPPFLRFFEEEPDENDPPPRKRVKSDTKSK